MTCAADLSGCSFGLLTVIERSGSKNKKAMWKCICKCGNVTFVNSNSLKSGKTRSCGCLSRKHGFARKERLYNIWVGMRQRCNDVNVKDYPRYGGRGISVCDEWDDYSVFREWALSNRYSDALSIDRIDGDGNYEPANCRWVEYKTQNNNLSTNRIISYNGKSLTMAQWADKAGLSYNTFKSRIRRGWSIAQILSTPQRAR